MSWSAKIDHEDCNYVTDHNTKSTGFATKMGAYRWAADNLASHDSTGSSKHEKLTITVTEECDHNGERGRERWVKAARDFLDSTGNIPIVKRAGTYEVFCAVSEMKEALADCQSCGEKL